MKKISIMLILALLCLSFSAQAAPQKPVFRGAPKQQSAAPAEKPAKFEKTDKPESVARREKTTFRGAPEMHTAAPTEEPIEQVVFDDPLLNIAWEIASGVHELAGDELFINAYMSMMTCQFLPRIAESDFSDLNSAVRIVLPEKAFLGAINLAYVGVSPTGRAKMASNLLTSIPTLWNGQSAQAIPEMTIVSWSRAYPMPENFSPCAILLDCGGIAYWVSFSEAGEGIMSASGMPILLGEDESVSDFIQNFTDEFPLGKLMITDLLD